MKSKFIMCASMLSVLMTACSGQNEQKNQALNVQVLDVQSTGTTTNDRFYVGTVESDMTTAVSFNGSGVLTRICVSEGQHVQKGQLIAEIDKAQAQNMLMASEASVKQADDALARMKQLHETQSISDMDWVEVQSKVEQAHAQLEMARKNLADCSLFAPVSGVIGRGIKHVGEVVLPSVAIVNILSINQVKVKVSIPEKEIALVSSDTPSNIQVDALGNESYRGSRIEKGVEADMLTHTYNVLINVSNTDGKLLPGMVCKVNLQNDATQIEQKLLVPIRCVQQSADGQHFLWVAQAGKAHRQQVVLGNAVGNDIVISQGLSMGDKVIIAGYQKVSEGSEIQIIR